MEIPVYITKELFQKAFENYYNSNDVRILEYKSKWAVPPGDNFTSDLLRVTVTYTLNKDDNKKTMAVLVKISPETREGIIYTIKDMKLFDKEIEMYTKILPQLDNILGNKSTLAPKCLYVQRNPVQLLILEDLSPLGYKMLDRLEGLDLEHCLLVMKKLAHLHASSAVMYEREQTAFVNYFRGTYSEHPFIDHWFNISVDCIVKTCTERPGMEKFVDKLKRVRSNFFQKCTESMRVKEKEFNVLNHGDCWTNNCLFLYDSCGNLTDLKLIDFQLGIYCGPGVDLQYFWSTTPNMSVRLEHFDTVFDYYYDQLVSTLIKLNYPTEKLPVKEDLYKDYCSKMYFGFAGAVTALPLFKSDSREDASLEELLKPLEQYEGSFREHVYTNPRSWKFITHVLPAFEKLGIFD